MTPWTEARQTVLTPHYIAVCSIMSIKLVMPSNHLILCCPLLLLPSIFPSIRVFYSELVLPIRWPKYWTWASVLPMNIQGWFPLGSTVWISLLSKGLSRAPQFRNTNSLVLSLLYGPTLILTWLLEKSQLWLYGPLSTKWWLLFNTLSRFVIAFLPRSKHFLISRLQSCFTASQIYIW